MAGKVGRPKKGATVTVLKEGKVTEIEVAREMKKAEAVSMRIAGANYRDIAQALDIDTATAVAYVREAVTSALPEEHKKTLIALELGRLDRLTNKYLAAALGAVNVHIITKDGDPLEVPIPFESSVKAARLVLDVSDRRAKLAGLYDIGTDDPSEMNLDAVDREFERLVALADSVKSEE